jgi:uncharacterized protein
MTPEQHDLLAKANESLRASRVLLSEGFAGFAASRAYYAMFYSAQALLEGEGLSYSKHSGVVAGFGKHFARTGRVPTELHRYLIEAMEVRHQGDYALGDDVSEENAEEQIAHAQEFIRVAAQTI